jgi:mannose-1-phosphate guanylyltransferase/mannose-6-phosphate isomerase
MPSPSQTALASPLAKGGVPITPVILCGGSGTRLWPLSRKGFPKQFVPLINGKSLLQCTLERVRELHHPSQPQPIQPICIAAEEHQLLVSEALQAAGMSGTLILEPVPRNTAAAMALAALHARPEELLLFCPSDHHIPDAEAFAAMVHQGSSAALSGAIVTFGVVPSFPSTAYGYIQLGAALQVQPGQGLATVHGHHVARFIEKPNLQAAQALLLQGDVLWNAGIFLIQAQTLLQALATHALDILQSCQQAMAAATASQVKPDQTAVRPEPAAFAACRAQSIDYAVLEHNTDVVVIPFAGAWSDVGSWNAVAELSPADAQGNRLLGQAMSLSCNNTYIHAPHRLVVALGTQDLLIIDTPDALLVAHPGHVEQVRDVVAELDRRQALQTVQALAGPQPVTTP